MGSSVDSWGEHRGLQHLSCALTRRPGQGDRAPPEKAGAGGHIQVQREGSRRKTEVEMLFCIFVDPPEAQEILSGQGRGAPRAAQLAGNTESPGMSQVGRAMPLLLGFPCDLGGDLTLGMESCPAQTVSRPPSLAPSAMATFSGVGITSSELQRGAAPHSLTVPPVPCISPIPRLALPSPAQPAGVAWRIHLETQVSWAGGGTGKSS